MNRDPKLFNFNKNRKTFILDRSELIHVINFLVKYRYSDNEFASKYGLFYDNYIRFDDESFLVDCGLKLSQLIITPALLAENLGLKFEPNTMFSIFEIKYMKYKMKYLRLKIMMNK